MSDFTFHVFETRPAACIKLAALVADRLAAVITAEGRAGLIVPGGATPTPFFHALRDRPIDWAQVIITVSDERCVPDTHQDSNARLIRTELMQGAAAAASFAGLYPEVDLGAFPWPAGAQVLGMGTDGHIASLFPGAPELDGLLDPHAPLAGPLSRPDGAVPRISLSAPALNSSRWTALLITGEDKRAMLSAARKPGAIRELPVRVLLQKPLEVFWAP
jgi:6-phosphogluconolactonase